MIDRAGVIHRNEMPTLRQSGLLYTSPFHMSYSPRSILEAENAATRLSQAAAWLLALVSSKLAIYGRELQMEQCGTYETALCNYSDRTATWRPFKNSVEQSLVTGGQLRG